MHWKHRSCLLLMAMTITFVDPITGEDIENSNVIVDKDAGTLFHHYPQHHFSEITLPLESASYVFLVDLVLTYLAFVYRYVLIPNREEDDDMAEILNLKIWQNGDIRYKDYEDEDTLRRGISDKFWSDPLNRERLSACSMSAINLEEEYGEFDDDSFMKTLPGDDVDCEEMNDLQDPLRDIQRNTVRTEISRAQQLREEQKTIDEEEDEVRGRKGNIKIKSTKETKKRIHRMGREAATENSSGNTSTKSLSMDRSGGIVNESTSKKKVMGNTNGQDDSRQKQEQQQNDQFQEDGNETKNGLNQSLHEMQSIGARTNREWVTFTASQNPLQDSIQTVDSENDEHSDEHDEKAIECETKGGDEWVPILEPQESTTKEQDHLTLDGHTKQETDAETVQNGKDQNNADHHNSTEQQEIGATRRWRNTEHSHDDSMRPLLTPVNRLKLSIEIPTTDETPSQENDNGTMYESNKSMIYHSNHCHQ